MDGPHDTWCSAIARAWRDEIVRLAVIFIKGLRTGTCASRHTRRGNSAKKGELVEHEQEVRGRRRRCGAALGGRRTVAGAGSPQTHSAGRRELGAQCVPLCGHRRRRHPLAQRQGGSEVRRGHDQVAKEAQMAGLQQRPVHRVGGLGQEGQGGQGANAPMMGAGIGRRLAPAEHEHNIMTWNVWGERCSAELACAGGRRDVARGPDAERHDVVQRPRLNGDVRAAARPRHTHCSCDSQRHHFQAQGRPGTQLGSLHGGELAGGGLQLPGGVHVRAAGGKPALRRGAHGHTWSSRSRRRSWPATSNAEARGRSTRASSATTWSCRARATTSAVGERN